MRTRLEAWLQWWKARAALDDHGSWASGPLCGPGLGAVMHWTTTAGTAEELEAAGLSLIALYDPEGHRLSSHNRSTSTILHVLARRVV